MHIGFFFASSSLFFRSNGIFCGQKFYSFVVWVKLEIIVYRFCFHFIYFHRSLQTTLTDWQNKLLKETGFKDLPLIIVDINLFKLLASADAKIDRASQFTLGLQAFQMVGEQSQLFKFSFLTFFKHFILFYFPFSESGDHSLRLGFVAFQKTQDFLTHRPPILTIVSSKSSDALRNLLF